MATLCRMTFRPAFFWKHVLPAVLAFSLALALAQTIWIQRVENLLLDVCTQLRTKFLPPADARLLVVGIDDGSIDALGRWPWSRRVHGQFMYSLSFGKPAVMAWDILFIEPTDADGMLVGGAQSLPGRVVFGGVSSDESAEAPADAAKVTDLTEPITNVAGNLDQITSAPAAMLPLDQVRAAGFTGFVDTPAGADGVRREVPMLIRVAGRIFPSLSLQTVLRYWGIAAKDVRVVLGDAIYLESPGARRRIPIDGHGSYLVNYRYNSTNMNVYGYAPMLYHYTKRYVQKDLKDDMPLRMPVDGKILLVGQMSTGLSDNGPTPFSPETPLVFVHANVIDNILREDYARRLPWLPVWLGGCVLSIAGLAFFSRRRLQHQAFFSLGVPVLYLLVAAYAWIHFSRWLPFVWPLLGFGALQVLMVGRRILAEQRAKEQVKKMFSTYLSSELLGQLLAEGRQLELGGKRPAVTIFFSDLRNFTAIAENRPAEELFAQLNEYFTAMVECVNQENGTLHKFIGDAIMAVWGDLVSQSPADDARRAARAALQMQVELRRLNISWAAKNWPQLAMGIGINHGEVLVGNIGAPQRMEFTVIGDPVNLASRLESLNKELKSTLLVGETVKNLLGDGFHLRPRGAVPVKGKAQPVEVFELLEKPDETASPKSL